MFALNLITPAVLRAADTDDGHATVSGSTTTAANTTAPKHHHRHKKPIGEPTTGSRTITPPADTNDLHVGTVGNNTDAPGMSNSIGSNNPGTPNMGTADHVPGTTGTSGQ
jgi:hypothetical protein